MRTKNILLTALFAANFAQSATIEQAQIDAFRAEATDMVRTSFAGATDNKTGHGTQFSAVRTVFRAELAVLEANKYADNASDALDRLKALCSNLPGTSTNEHATATMIIGHMQTQKIGELPKSFSILLDQTEEEKQLNLIHELYSAWVARAMTNLNDDAVTVTRNDQGKIIQVTSPLMSAVHKFNHANGERNTEEARKQIAAIAKEVEFQITQKTEPSESVEMIPSHQEIIKAAGRVAGNDMKAELLRSVFATYMATKEEKAELSSQRQYCGLMTAKHIVLFACLIAANMLAVGFAFWVANSHYDMVSRVENAETKFDNLNNKIDPALGTIRHIAFLENSFNLTKVNEFVTLLQAGTAGELELVNVMIYIGQCLKAACDASSWLCPSTVPTSLQ